jgi:hypothetical protein
MKNSWLSQYKKPVFIIMNAAAGTSLAHAIASAAAFASAGSVIFSFSRA